MEIAVLGMGRMGRAVAQRLLDGGHQVVVWNRSKGRAGEVVSAGAREVDTITQAVVGREVVVSSVADDEALRAVALGNGGVRSCLGSDAVHVDASTVSPQLCAELEAGFDRFVAMPILGSPDMVRGGQAVYLAGGPSAVLGRLEPIFAALTDTVRRYDRAPQAAFAKLASNLLLLSGVASLAEAFTLGRLGGLTDDQLRELLGQSPMVAPGVRNRFEGVLTGNQEPWWTTTLGAKDAGLAVDAAAGAGADLPVAGVVNELYDEVAAKGHADDDISAVRLWYPHPGGPGRPVE